MDNIPLNDLKANYLTVKAEVDAAIKKVIDNSSFINGPFVENFEKEFAKATNSKFCVTASNGTSTLLLAMQAILLKPGDEVITVPNTFIATTEAITFLGGKVKFVDVEEKTLLMNPGLLEKAITKKTKAIIPVHLYGQMCDMGAIKEIADKHNLRIIEDAAQSHLAEFSGKQAGYYGDIASYSFFPAKNLGCFGDGGAITTNNEEYAKKIAMLRDHGRLSKYEHLIEGFNFRLDALQAAILSAKLKHLGEWTSKRRKNAEIYNELLNDAVEIPFEAPGRKHVYYTYTIMAEKREKLMRHLEKNGIATGIYYPIPLHLQKAYEHLNLKSGSFPVAEKASKRILALPMYPELKESQIKYICEKVKEGLRD